jgi:hypothetical protein
MRRGGEPELMRHSQTLAHIAVMVAGAVLRVAVLAVVALRNGELARRRF